MTSIHTVPPFKEIIVFSLTNTPNVGSEAPVATYGNTKKETDKAVEEIMERYFTWVEKQGRGPSDALENVLKADEQEVFEIALAHDNIVEHAKAAVRRHCKNMPPGHEVEHNIDIVATSILFGFYLGYTERKIFEQK